MGKMGKDVKAGELEAKIQDAAMEAAMKAAKECKEAKKDNAAATCADLADTFNKAKGTSKPTDAKKQKQQLNVLKQGAASAANKGNYEVCLEDLKTKEEVQTCMDGLESETKDT